MTTTTQITVGEKREGLERWRKRIEDSTEDYATDAWKAAAFALIERHREALAFADDDTVLPTIEQVNDGYAAEFFTEQERMAVRWQFAQHLGLSRYWQALLKAAEQANGVEAARLALAYPDLVEGIRRYREEKGFWVRIDTLLAR